jgi:hypothetical protein
MRSSCRSLLSFLVAAPLALAALCSLEPLESRARGATPDGARHARSPDGLFWFMHVSDTHIGANLIEGPKAKQHLTFALNEAVDVIKPSFVWNTGDLEDGSGKVGIDGTGIPTSGQSQTQWDWYKQIYQGAGMKLGFYYDLPGNHDAYGDDGLKFYLANSLWGASQKKTWMDFKVVTSTGEYGFFGMNSTNNYFKPLGNCCPGFLDAEIAELDAWLQKNAGAKLVFVAAHHSLDGNGSYPTAKADQVRALLKANKAFYIHGDVHEYKEYLDTPTGVVVNEIGSLGKGTSSNLGVGVVDHDAFVYRATDVEGAWPFVILTSPVSATLRDVGANPWAYSVCKNRPDNPFRAVTFSYLPPTKVVVKVGTLPEVAMAPVKGSFDFAYPVWQAEVDTRALVAGLVDVTVRVEAVGGTNSHQITAKFDDGACGPVDPPPDAGPPDADPIDSGTDSGAPAEAGADAGADTGAPLVDTMAEAGCSCSVPGQAEHAGEDGRPASAPIVAGALALVLARARRRR